MRTLVFERPDRLVETIVGDLNKLTAGQSISIVYNILKKKGAINEHDRISSLSAMS